MFYFEVLSAMEERKIKYLIVGGLAVNLHNVQRMTNDIDFIISMDKDNILKFVNLMKNMGYVPKLPVEPELLADKNTLEDWINNKNMKAFSFYHKKENYQVIDIVISQPLNFNKAYNKRVVKIINGINVSLISIDDLIKMKEAAGRVKDFDDIKKLELVKQIEKGTGI